MTFNVTAQPGVLAKLRASTDMNEGGGLARFGMVVPRDRSYERRNTSVVPAEVGEPYQGRLRDLIVEVMRRDTPSMLTLTAQAYKVVLDAELDLIDMRLPGGILHGRDDVANKFVGRVVRLARVVHMMTCAEIAADPGHAGKSALDLIVETPISEDTMRHGLALALWMAEHTMIALDAASPAHAHGLDAGLFEKVRRYLCKRYDADPMAPIPKRYIGNGVWGLDGPARDAILAALVDVHHVVEGKVGRTEVVYLHRDAPRVPEPGQEPRA